MTCQKGPKPSPVMPKLITPSYGHPISCPIEAWILPRSIGNPPAPTGWPVDDGPTLFDLCVDSVKWPSPC